MAQHAPLPTFAFAEADVRRLCGAREVARADLLQRAGHVLRPLLDGPATLRATVRGTWRRQDTVSVRVQGRALEGACSCAAGEPCRHLGALLLHWLREPATFGRERQPHPATPPVGPTVAALLDETPEAELARLLDRHTVAALREIGRARGETLPNRPKPELVAQLAAALAAPVSVDAALAALTPDERHTLDAVHLLSALGSIAAERLDAAARALGAADVPHAVAGLGARGLVLSEGYSDVPWVQRTLPRAVAARLWFLDSAVSAARGKAPAPAAPAVEALFVAIAQALGGRDVQRRGGFIPERVVAGRTPEGYYSGGAPALGFGGDVSAIQQQPRQIVGARLLRSPDLRALSQAVGQSPALIAFATHLMAALGILEGQSRLQVHDERLAALLGLPPGERRARVARAWLAIADWTELAHALGEGGGLTLTFAATYYGVWLDLFYDVISLRRLAARVVGRLAPHQVYEGAALVKLLHALAPDLFRPARPGLATSWTFTRGDPPGQRLDPAAPEDWTRIAGALVAVSLRGPLTWLGLVEIVSTQPLAFRVRPAAGALVERALPADAGAAPAPLVVGDDLTVRLPAGNADTALHALLTRVGSLAGATDGGLVYQLSAERVQAAFETGLSGPELLATLAAAAGGTLPAGPRRRLAAWWDGYGSVRLYDDLTLVELGEDALLPELLATKVLGTALVHQFSPRLIAVHPDEVGALVARLTRHGYTPRVVEDA